MIKSTFPALCLAASIAAASAQISSVDLSQYYVSSQFSLPDSASEASAVTWNSDNGNLFIVGDEGGAIVEVTKTGATVSTMSLSGFEDTEGITYVGNNQFLVVEERLQNAYLVTYVAGGSVSRSTLTSFDFGSTVGNIGLEGISYDPVNNVYFGVKEKSPQLIYQATLNLSTGTVETITNPFDPTVLSLADLADVQALSTVSSLLGTADQDNLLILSQEEGTLLEVDRTTGAILSSYDVSGISSSIEGVTIDEAGNIYLSSEDPMITVLSPVSVPEPSAVLLILLAMPVGVFFLRRRKTLTAVAGACCLVAASSQAQITITEYMYNGSEYVELTNIGNTAVNMAGWSYSDESRAPGAVDLSGFGVIEANESVIFCESTAAAFRDLWVLGVSVKVIGGVTSNLGRNDEINIYNGTTLVDRLNFGDEEFSGTIRANGVSGNPESLSTLGADDAAGWVYAQPGDIYGSFASVSGGNIGNPGIFNLIPEPGSVSLLGLGGLFACLRRRRNS